MVAGLVVRMRRMAWRLNILVSQIENIWVNNCQIENILVINYQIENILVINYQIENIVAAVPSPDWFIVIV